jgi:phenylacetate-coenzyme A ligase PaaK-like adenylate-forming protein
MPPAPLQALATFCSQHIDSLLHDAEAADGAARPPGATLRAYEVFKVAAAGVPAYQELLRGLKATPFLPSSFDLVPYTSKENYHRAYPLEARCQRGGMGGSSGGAEFVHVSSGSSGQPTPWARNVWDELVTAAVFEQVDMCVRTCACVAFAHVFGGCFLGGG